MQVSFKDRLIKTVLECVCGFSLTHYGTSVVQERTSTQTTLNLLSQFANNFCSFVSCLHALKGTGSGKQYSKDFLFTKCADIVTKYHYESHLLRCKKKLHTDPDVMLVNKNQHCL